MATDWQIGDLIQNRWQVYDVKRGGMGIVYIVYDHEHRRTFAAKTFQDDLFARNAAIADRFTEEALAWVKLDIHQNITEARFVWKIEDKPYLFLEYVTGGDLSGWIGTPRLTEDLPQVLRFAIQFCDGMTHARAMGIAVHRDIKPQNCLITADRVLKVSDFGLAKALDELEADGLVSEKPDSKKKRAGGILGRLLGGPQASRNVEMETREPHGLRIGLTRTGMAMGTPAYMAPEQFEDSKRVDLRADIYSFGVMLFEMVTGRLPFAGRTWKELGRSHRTGSPPSLGTRHSSLVTVVQTCLEKDPAKRFGSFQEVRGQLADLHEDLMGSVAPEPVAGGKLDAEQLSNKGASLYFLGRNDEAIEC